MVSKFKIFIATLFFIVPALFAVDANSIPPSTEHQVNVAYVAAGAALCSLIVSIIAVFMSGMASNLNKKMFKRQSIIDLHIAWRGINEVDVNALVTPDVVAAVNALDLTASLWNHDVVEKVVLYQSYWSPYKSLYDTLKYSQAIPPGQKKKLCELITREMDRAYRDMDNYNPAIQTTL